MNTETYSKEAIGKLGITNFLKQIMLSVKWILNPKSAVELAKKIVDSDHSKNKNVSIIAVGYLNEFFSRYIVFAKSNKDAVAINEIVDKQSLRNFKQELSLRNKKIKNDSKLLNVLIELRTIRNKLSKLKSNRKDQVLITTKAFGVSSGIVTGKIINVKDGTEKINKTNICVFETSGTKFTNVYNKCGGIIFKNGAITSHGAIIAREYSIPAIVYPNIKMDDDKDITIDGTTGQISI